MASSSIRPEGERQVRAQERKNKNIFKMETKTTEKQELILTYMALYDKLYGDVPPYDLSSWTNEELEHSIACLQTFLCGIE